jgi:hypothetical protein
MAARASFKAAADECQAKVSSFVDPIHGSLAAPVEQTSSAGWGRATAGDRVETLERVAVAGLWV